MSRTAALGVICLALLSVGTAVGLFWPSAQPLDCPPEQLRFSEGEVATCDPSVPKGAVPAGAALTLGMKLDLNRATEQELSLVSGVGPSLAKAIVSARADAGFRSWDELDRVPGVGPVKLEALRAAAEIR